MDFVNIDFIYTAISWILLRWHELWDMVLPQGPVLGTTFDWILSIVFLVLTVRVLLFPLFIKQIRAQRAMQALQPQIKELQKKHKGDRQTLQQETMKLYQESGANPLMGCLPILLQLPVFFGIFHILRRIAPDKSALYGWTEAQMASAVEAKLFGAPIAATFGSSAADLARMDAASLTVKIVAGTLVAIMIVTTYLTTKQMLRKSPPTEDPNQKLIQRMMLYGIPVTLLFSGAIFPIGVVIYWVTTNLFSLGQQQWVLHKYPPPNLAANGNGNGATGKAGAKAGGKDAKVGAKNGEEPKIDGKALAPRPGVKPVNTKKSKKRKARR